MLLAGRCPRLRFAGDPVSTPTHRNGGAGCNLTQVNIMWDILRVEDGLATLRDRAQRRGWARSNRRALARYARIVLVAITDRAHSPTLARVGLVLRVRVDAQYRAGIRFAIYIIAVILKDVNPLLTRFARSSVTNIRFLRTRVGGREERLLRFEGSYTTTDHRVTFR